MILMSVVVTGAVTFAGSGDCLAKKVTVYESMCKKEAGEVKFCYNIVDALDLLNENTVAISI